ncbi:MAG: helix-turn-helix transcriptional regulator [Aliishimia sp.]
MHNEHMNNLSVYRDIKGLTQTQLAEMIGANQSKIQRAEKEHKSAKLETYKQCAEALGVSLSDIFSDDRSKLENELISALASVPKERLTEVRLFLKAAAGQPDEAE